MQNRRVLLAAGVITLALIIVIVGLRFAMAPNPRALAPQTTPRLWWPSATVLNDRAGAPSNPQATTLPWQTTQTFQARLTQGLPPAEPDETTQTPGLTFPTATRTLEASEPPPTTPAPDPLACLPEQAHNTAEGDFAPVAWVSDGSSFVIDRQGGFQTVRLIGVDAPPIAARRLEALLLNQIVHLVPDPNGPDTDATGQLLRYVLTLDGILINDELLRSGEARLDKDAAAYTCREQFAAAEENAQSARLGVWGVVAALPAPTRTPAPTSAVTATAIIAAAPTATQGTIAPTATGQPTASATAGPSPTATATATTASGGGGGGIGAATPTATPSGQGENEVDGPMVITNIFTIGTLPNEADEYMEIKNTGSAAVDLTGWSLYSDDTFAEVYFPTFSLAPGQSCRVYTNVIRSDSCAGVSFEWPEEAWVDDTGCGGLYDADEWAVYSYCYPSFE